MDNRNKLYEGLEKYSEIEAQKQKVEAKQKFQAIQEKRTRLPVNRFLLLLLLTLITYLWYDDFYSYNEGAKSKKSSSFVGYLVDAFSQTRLAKKIVATTSKDQADQSNLEKAESALPAVLADSNDFTSGRYVQISGKYYQYRSDHRYLIDGQLVYFNSRPHPVQAPSPKDAKNELEK